jgi:hypothetical protein
MTNVVPARRRVATAVCLIVPPGGRTRDMKNLAVEISEIRILDESSPFVRFSILKSALP